MKLRLPFSESRLDRKVPWRHPGGNLMALNPKAVMGPLLWAQANSRLAPREIRQKSAVEDFTQSYKDSNSFLQDLK